MLRHRRPIGQGCTQEICKRKDELLKAALEYNAFAGQFNQEAEAIDFKTSLHGPFCRIYLRDSLQQEIHD